MFLTHYRIRKLLEVKTTQTFLLIRNLRLFPSQSWGQILVNVYTYMCTLNLTVNLQNHAESHVK